ncbi:MAG: polyphosphate polymerase domain-containing protein [Bacteroidota bacterium]|nr:polyphosphate polymerase domain-containing protein [Bacteroidota bacterium]
MHFIRYINEELESVSLEEMDAVRLMDRVDTKFICSLSELATLFEMTERFYRVLAINDKRVLKYMTKYFDTDSFAMYFAHQNGKLNRHKIRERIYIETGTTFLEVKFKNNKNRTIKSRIPRVMDGDSLNESEKEFLAEYSPFKAEELRLTLWNQFNRITLVSDQERITIDFDLGFSKGDDQYMSLPPFAILEVKQNVSSPDTPIMKILNELDITPIGVSKYCMGVASVYPNIKANRIKPVFMKIELMNQ